MQVDPHKAGDAATRVMQQLYTRRNTFSHDDFNRTHDVRNFTKKHISLQEAVNALLRQSQDVTIDEKQADNRGEKRYLLRCLYQRGALTQIHAPGAHLTIVEVERDPSKFEQSLPALADMIRQVHELKEGDRISLWDFITKYRQPPYGLGEIALSLLFAVLLRYFGDAIKVKKDDAAIGDLYVADFEMVYDILKGNYPHAFIRYREIRPGERALINGVHDLFTGPVSAAQANVTVTEAYDTIAGWYENLPPVSQVTSFYHLPESAQTIRLLDLLEKLRARDPHAFVLGDLQTVVGYEADELITEERAKELLAVLEAAKEQVEGTLERVQSRIRDGLCEIFGVQGNTWDDLADGVRAWYNELDPNQRSTSAGWHNDASKPLAQLFLDLSNPREVFVDKLPERPSYNFGRVHGWNADLVDDYLSKIRDGVRHIEANKIKVPPLDPPELIGEYRQEGNYVFFSGPLTLRLSHPDESVRVFVTDTGNNPIVEVKERSEFRGSQSFDIGQLVQARRSSLTISYVPQDAEGNWGIIQALTFFDETLENEIRKPPALLKEHKVPIKFVFPTTEAGFVRACRTFFESILENEVVDRGRLRQLVQQILDDLTSKGVGD